MKEKNVISIDSHAIRKKHLTISLGIKTTRYKNRLRILTIIQSFQNVDMSVINRSMHHYQIIKITNKTIYNEED